MMMHENTFQSILIILIVFLLLDYIWIYVINKDMWIDQIKLVQGGQDAEFRYSGGVFVYLVMTLATFFLVIYPIKNYLNIESKRELIIRSSIMGSILGLAMYGVFDGTNYVMFKDYKFSVALQDTLYGVFVTSIASVCGTLIY